jgi:hypothetical protein
MRAKLSLAIASVLVSAIAATAPADAACKKFGFTVNDYGKEGPTNDAKNLLDKHISEWAAQNGVTAYQTGKKSVNCELFLDVLLFDEHTCTASASVCWGDGVKPNNKGAEQAEVTGDGNGEMPPAPVSKAVALGIPAQPQTAAAAAPTEAAAAPTAPVEQVAAPAETPAATPAVHTPAATPAVTTGGVETGALQVGQGAAAVQNITPPPAPPAANQDRAAAASAAAAAAAAAERAAMAAETAANAAKEAAAAAVAASAASKGPATVPPLDHASGATPTHNE